MFNKVGYWRGVIEGIVLYLLGRLGALINPAFFPDWTFVAAPLFFLLLQYLIAPLWTTRRIAATKRERLSKRFWLLGPTMTAICFALDFVITMAIGLPVSNFGVQQGPALMRFAATGSAHLSFADYGLYELRTAVALLSFFTLTVICTKLAQGGFLRFTMPAGGNRVTL